MKQWWSALLLAGNLLTGIAGCNSSQTSASDAVAARVNETTLTMEDLKDDIPALSQTTTPEMKQDWVQQWIQSELLYQEALNQELHKDRKIARELQKMQRDYLANLVLERFLSEQSPDVSEAEIQQFYTANRREFVRQDPELKLSVIVLRDERTARDLWRQLGRRGQDFAETARARSIDTGSARNGGDLGWVKKSDISDPTVQRVVFAMRVGDLSAPVRTENGFCLFMVTDRHETGSLRAVEEVRGDIVNRALEERRRKRMKQLVDGLRRSAEVEVNDALLKAPSSGTPAAMGANKSP